MENLNAEDLLKTNRAGKSLFYVVTDRERSTEKIVARTASDMEGAGSPYVWTCTGGFIRDGEPVKDTINPLSALDFAVSQTGPAVFLFKDLSSFWANDPFIIRKLKEFVSKARSKILIVMGEDEAVPERLRENLVILYQGIPVLQEIKAHLESLKDRFPSLSEACASDSGLMDRLVVAAQGLYIEDIDFGISAFNQSGGSSDKIVQEFFETKQQVIRKSGIMEFIVNDTEIEHLGGMENLKKWLERREMAFGLENISSGLNMPKGVLLMGVSGCGKSLFVKVIATRWRVPLIRLDMSVVYGGAFGSPETSLRKAFRIAEAIAPCVLWIDEIEAGISSQGFKAEGGAASRVLGTFLTWMQEKSAPVFVAATANAIEMLPAEMLRKGRFDEIYYMGLPDEKAREEIFLIHMNKQNIDAAGINVPLLSRLANRFSGAEIEQVVKSAAFEAFADKRPITEEDFKAVLRRTVPLSVTMDEQVKSIEGWAFKRAVPASGELRR